MAADRFKYFDTTHSSMSELLTNLKKEKHIEDICKKHGLNINLLWDLFKASAQGYNNTQIAQRLGINRVTAQRYADALRKLTETDFEELFNYLIEKRTHGKKI